LTYAPRAYLKKKRVPEDVEGDAKEKGTISAYDAIWHDERRQNNRVSDILSHATNL
jgi:hypothetical protein